MNAPPLIFILLFNGVYARTLFTKCKFLDLTHDISHESTLYWDGAERFKLIVKEKGIVEPVHFYMEEYKFESAEHGGTHIDAPSHFNEHGSTLEKVNLTSLIGPACVINISNQSSQNIDYQLTIEDLIRWEKINGEMDQDCIVFMYTGRDKLYHDRSLYFGSKTPNDLSTYHFPGLSKEAAKWLIDNHKIKMFGSDTPSFDYGPSTDFIVHRILFANEIPAIENLMNLGKVPAKGATVIALPMKIRKGSGSPVRAMAIVECPSKATTILKGFFYLILLPIFAAFFAS